MKPEVARDPSQRKRAVPRLELIRFRFCAIYESFPITHSHKNKHIPFNINLCIRVYPPDESVLDTV